MKDKKLKLPSIEGIEPAYSAEEFHALALAICARLKGCHDLLTDDVVPEFPRYEYQDADDSTGPDTEQEQ